MKKLLGALSFAVAVVLGLAAAQASTLDDAKQRGKLICGIAPNIYVLIGCHGVHVLIAVDERFTTPALPLVGLLAGARLAALARRRVPTAVRYAT